MPNTYAALRRVRLGPRDHRRAVGTMHDFEGGPGDARLTAAKIVACRLSAAQQSAGLAANNRPRGHHDLGLPVVYATKRRRHPALPAGSPVGRDDDPRLSTTS